MPSGIEISHESRQLIVNCLIVCNKTCAETQLLTAHLSLSLSYLRWLKIELQKNLFRDNYLAGPHAKLGRPRLLDQEQRSIMKDMVAQKPKNIGS